MPSMTRLFTARRAGWTLACLGLLLASGGAFAHFPAGPIRACQDDADEGEIHEYLGFDAHRTDGVRAIDGNVPSECTGGGFDKDYEFAFGGALLAHNTGDGTRKFPGTDLCYGVVGHHSTSIRAYDEVGRYGPALLVAADHPRVPSEEPCGDGILEPCVILPPAPSTAPFPVNVAEDTANQALYALLSSPDSAGCNPKDEVQLVASNPHGETSAIIPFTSGADGAFHVMVLAEPNAGRVPVSGHVWSVG